MYSSKEQKDLWHTYKVAKTLFRYDEVLPTYLFDRSIRKSEFNIYVTDEAEIDYIEEMKAKEVLERFSVTDCVEVVASILGVQPRIK